MAASCAPYRLEPRIQSGTLVPSPGIAWMNWFSCGGPSKDCSSTTSCGKFSDDAGLRRNACSVCWSVPGALPSPRSMRSGNNVARVPNCSAITIGEWFGNIMPPAPIRIVLVPPATWQMQTAVAALAMPARLWCSASQKRVKPAASAC